MMMIIVRNKDCRHRLATDRAPRAGRPANRGSVEPGARVSQTKFGHLLDIVD
jgi:hypothetical protein